MSENRDQAIGNNVRRLRKERHLSKADMARELELHETNYSFRESGRRSFTVSELHHLSAILKMPVEEILQGVPPGEKFVPVAHEEPLSPAPVTAAADASAGLLNDKTLELLDQLCRKMNSSRSELLHAMISERLEGKPAVVADIAIAPLPDILEQRIGKFGEWQAMNKKQARHEGLLFWLIKGLAIGSAFVSGLDMGISHWMERALSLLASGMVSLDSVARPGILRAAHATAASEIKTLCQRVRDMWTEGGLRQQEPRELIAEILEEASKGEERINAFLEQAESHLGAKSPTVSRRSAARTK